MCVEMLGIYYNVDLFQEAGIDKVPTTFAELEEACEKLQANNITPFAATYKDSWTLNHLFSCLQGNAVEDATTWIDEMNSGTGSF